MIEVSIDLNKWGLGEKTTLYFLKIWNDGTGTLKRGNYKWSITTRNGRKWKSGELKDWPRQSKSAFKLIQAIVNQI